MPSLVPAILPSRAIEWTSSPRPPCWRGALAFVRACLARREQRLDLIELTDDQLRDIGLSRPDADREGRRRPWDGPAPDA